MGRTKKISLNFTVKSLDALAPAKARYNVFDSQTRSLGLVVHPSGTKNFFHLKKINGWPERTTIGAFPDLSIERARGKAGELNGKLANWKASDFEGANPIKRPRKVPTLGVVLDHYVEHHVPRTAKNPAEAQKYRRWQFDSYLPSWRNRPLSSIDRKDVIDLHKQIGSAHGEVTANRTLTFIRTLFHYAADPDVALWSGGNPAAKPKKILFHESSRKRIVERTEAPIFFAELQKEPHRDLRDVLLLALLTAARRKAIFQMRWDQLDWQRGLWIIPNPKGKKDTEPHIVALTKDALSVLRNRRNESEWVFPGKRGPLTTLKNPWAKFRKRAGLTDLTLHDLRRTIATVEGDTGASRETIQKTLGHEQDSAATKIYDRSQRRDAVREAIDIAMTAMFKSGKVSKVSRKKLLAAPQMKQAAHA